MPRTAHSVRESAHGSTGTAHGRGSATLRWASWADWAGSGVEGHLACGTLRMRHVGLSGHDTTAGPVGASSDRTEGLGDAIRNYDPSGGTGRLKSSRPDHSGRYDLPRAVTVGIVASGCGLSPDDGDVDRQRWPSAVCRQQLGGAQFNRRGHDQRIR